MTTTSTYTIPKKSDGSKRGKGQNTPILNLSSLKEAIQTLRDNNNKMDSTIEESGEDSPSKHKIRKVGVSGGRMCWRWVDRSVTGAKDFIPITCKPF